MASMILWTMASPRPAPEGLVVIIGIEDPSQGLRVDTAARV